MSSSKSVRITKFFNSKSRIRRMRSCKKRKSDTLQQTIGNQAVGRMIQAQLQKEENYQQEEDKHPVTEPLEDASNGPLEEDQQDTALQGKEKSDSPNLSNVDVQNNIHNLRGKGNPLPRSLRHYFESKFGADFSQVRIHTDVHANQAAESIHARAFTMGSDIIFGAGEYSPGSRSGQQLLAHELTHVMQQSGSKLGDAEVHDVNDENHNDKPNAIKRSPSRVSSSRNPIQRKILVDDTVPTDKNEPARGLSQSEFKARVFPQANNLVKGLCNSFKVDSGSGEVIPVSKNTCKDPDKVANKGAKPLGCCCLCTMTTTGTSTWKLVVSEFQGPHTDDRKSKREVVVHPFGSDFKFGNWAVPGSTTGSERLTGIDPVTILGHELCGHAALLELDAHAADADRVRSDVHDSTVRVQNVIGREQGVAVSDDRALASQGTHRGESTANVTLKNFPFNATSLSSLPAAQQRVLKRVKNFALVNRLWIDILGHSDTIGSPSAKLKVSQNRAKATRRFLIGQGLTTKFNRRGLVGVDRYTRVEGRSDFDLLPGSILGVRDPDLRRVDIVMTSRPAGAQNPVPGTPTDIANIDPSNPAKVASLKKSGNACEKLLVKTAWP